MRKIKEVLRLKLDARLSHEQIAAALDLSKGRDQICRPDRCSRAGLGRCPVARRRDAGAAPEALPALIEANFATSNARVISGHSMGGHGAPIVALRNPGRYRVFRRSRLSWRRAKFHGVKGHSALTSDKTVQPGRNTIRLNS